MCEWCVCVCYRQKPYSASMKRRALHSDLNLDRVLYLTDNKGACGLTQLLGP